jgi:hypothetical protein
MWVRERTVPELPADLLVEPEGCIAEIWPLLEEASAHSSDQLVLLSVVTGANSDPSATDAAKLRVSN